MNILNFIPTFPKVRFENYLDQLVDGNHSNSPIRVKGAEKFLDNSVKEIGQTGIEGELDISTSCLRGWIRGRRGIPLSSLRKILKIHLEPDTYQSVWNEIFGKIRYYTLGGSPHRVTLPLYITPRLLYFVGYLYGDGCISDAQKRSYETGGTTFEIKIADFSRTQIEGIARLFHHLFNVRAEIRDERICKGEQTYYIDPKCKIVHRFLNQEFNMPTGEKKNKLKVPPLMFHIPSKLHRWFIAGFFDADGSIFQVKKSGSKRTVVKFKQTSLEILQDIKYLLKRDMGIRLCGPYTEPEGAWSLSTEKRNTVEKFCKKNSINSSP